MQTGLIFAVVLVFQLSCRGGWILCMTDETIIMPRIIREVSIQRCVAECLGLVDQKKLCNFSQVSGGVLGDKCPENEFFNAAPSKKVLCSYSVWSLNALPFHETPIIKVCDFVLYIDLLRFNPGNSTISIAESEYQQLKSTLQYARVAGIKNILEIGGWGSALLFSKVGSNESIRDNFGAQLKGLLSDYSFDGVFIKWLYPNCPENTDCGIYKLDDKVGVKNMMKDLYQILKPSRKLLFYFANLNSAFLTFSAGDIYSPIADFVDYFVMDSFGQAGRWSMSIDVPTNLKKLISFDFFKNKIKNNKDVVQKILILLNVGCLTFELKTPNAHKIGSGFVQKSNLPPLTSFADVCEAVRKNNFTVVKDITTQHYAYRDKVWYAFDDYQSLLEKARFLKSIDGAGFGLFNTDMDDAKNRCGCGKMPFLRMIGELLKGGECELDRCP
ncbi:Hypothetical predicted protein [Cloeon dipterum]|uniref:GH18 domain-containing protein n=1 Tax=Cloeon dipterum TaxID=197152 RepID=A0A8S1C7U6_9INSE|nr:Hypothetical predicted protein [Cloeon dipterum]